MLITILTPSPKPLCPQATSPHTKSLSLCGPRPHQSRYSDATAHSALPGYTSATAQTPQTVLASINPLRHCLLDVGPLDVHTPHRCAILETRSGYENAELRRKPLESDAFA